MSSNAQTNKPVIGITVGDINSIGAELIIKTFADNRMLEFCTPVIFASNKTINFYRKLMNENNFNYQSLKEFSRLNHKQVNVFNCWEEEVQITPGILNETGGKYAARSLAVAIECLKNGEIDGLVTAPIHKKNIQSEQFNYTGHTPYLRDAFEAKDVLMFMTADNMRVGLLTEHVPIRDVAKYVTRENILAKLTMMKDSLIRDFGIDQPRIAVLGLNPHAGDDGLIGDEELREIIPAIDHAKNHGILCFGPYSADAFFARNMHAAFDGVLAMYHDQGLIPFKSLATGEGINFTAGLPIVRTSPDHGTAFDIAGKNLADHFSFRQAIFSCLDIIEKREQYDENTLNPLKKIELASE
ncbi:MULTISPECIES: 4-hydroxythreonine-4-phosphate dehydrogenase PdxA [unclassified Chitinophaga]|uniref:4-hydroxythreonine-4-phosphate dehydrogenase PdxA n=1 Tax=unclassified Chitinophaga TaxID=2619133 RepID=UPI0009CD8F49|nr:MULTISPECIES: 4-hydroxythreonine-4-phosphate dehydrogenase PdxA [unclassified Chitinophaga]OMP77930.1 4-hydroxythreonine-4-phosphate dehydrogenase PdxA [[Flexibacter] sp. ATCC 35208]WPV69152.1 4-hydroxythreonine-4-phosphate dehydrogenase PdxA [Chitinophaga sp. LS1]